MDPNLTGFVIALVVSAVVVVPLGGALRKHPAPFYAVAVVATLVYLWFVANGVNVPEARPFIAMMQKGYLASIMIAVVMFCGCFDEGSAVRRTLQPIRGELSVLSFVFILAHLATYLPGYLGRLGVIFASRSNVALSLAVACILTALFCVLAATSLRAVRKAMNARAWKALQRGAYVMVALLAVHIGLVLGRSAFVHPGSRAMWALIAYIAVTTAYAVLRLSKARRDAVRRRAS